MVKNTAVGHKKFWHSFRFASQGLVSAFKSELNMKVHCCLAVVVLVAAAVFRLPLASWMLLLFSITLVLTAELLNTAIEATVDLIHWLREQKIPPQELCFSRRCLLS